LCTSSLCLPICLSGCLPVWLPACLSDCLSDRQTICLLFTLLKGELETHHRSFSCHGTHCLFRQQNNRKNRDACEEELYVSVCCLFMYEWLPLCLYGWVLALSWTIGLPFVFCVTFVFAVPFAFLHEWAMGTREALCFKFNLEKCVSVRTLYEICSSSCICLDLRVLMHRSFLCCALIYSGEDCTSHYITLHGNSFDLLLEWKSVLPIM